MSSSVNKLSSKLSVFLYIINNDAFDLYANFAFIFAEHSPSSNITKIGNSFWIYSGIVN